MNSLPFNIRMKQILEKCNENNYIFHGFIGEYKNRDSKISIFCKTHGEWSVSIHNFTNGNCKCTRCSKLYRYSEEERIEQINKICKEKGYIFIGWENGYLKSKTKIRILCQKHGIWSVGLNDFINSDYDCAGCMKTGFNPKKPATLYVLKSLSGKYVKVGISNRYKQRISCLKRKTPFCFEIIKLFNSDGETILSLEKDFHSHFESAGLTGFDGCTEWLKWNPNITTLIDIL